MEDNNVQNQGNTSVAEKPEIGEGLVVRGLRVAVEGKEISKA